LTFAKDMDTSLAARFLWLTAYIGTGEKREWTGRRKHKSEPKSHWLL